MENGMTTIVSEIDKTLSDLQYQVSNMSVRYTDAQNAAEKIGKELDGLRREIQKLQTVRRQLIPTVTDTKTGYVVGGVKWAILKVLGTAPNVVMSPRELAAAVSEELGIKREAGIISPCLTELKRAGHIKHIARGQFSL